MALEIIGKYLNGLILFKPHVIEDERGFFMESFRASDLEKAGVHADFFQDNHSRSQKGVLRGMHFQWEPPQGKLIRVTRGEAFVAEVDIRRNSPSFGQWKGFKISEENKHILWVPPGFANGFQSLSENVEMQYKCTAYWNGKAEGSLLWNDSDIGIEWPLPDPIVSEKDSEGMPLKIWAENYSERFVY